MAPVEVLVFFADLLVPATGTLPLDFDSLFFAVLAVVSRESFVAEEPQAAGSSFLRFLPRLSLLAFARRSSMARRKPATSSSVPFRTMRSSLLSSAPHL